MEVENKRSKIKLKPYNPNSVPVHKKVHSCRPDGCTTFDNVGLLFVGGNFPIYRNNQGEYLTISDDTGEPQEFTWEERIMYLCKPWDQAGYYQDDEGKHHYLCNVYDGIHIDIWENTLPGLMALLCDMLTPTDEIENIITDRIAEHNKKLAEENGE